MKDGIETALKEVLKQLPPKSRDGIVAVNLGTTVSFVPKLHIMETRVLTLIQHFINAVVEKDVKKLARVAVLRLCGPYGTEVPPFAGLPDDLRSIVEGFSACLPGGLEGARPS